ncbi:MAG: LamG domain-containing protein, partial [Candidatus Pacebacteria bacterium]|nr:LamG domain-containing protein [Candidatus Paceibacterota bacterium]
ESADGVNFTITSRLSNANNYSFDSSTGLYSEDTPITTINGTCGTDNDTVTLSTPTNTCSTGTPSTVTTDPNTVLLMHMDGTDNGTTFNDQTGKTVTRYGDTKTVATTKKFGSASAYFDGTGDYLSLQNSADLDIASNDFTIDFWLYSTNNVANQGVFSQSVNSQSGNSYVSIRYVPVNSEFYVHLNGQDTNINSFLIKVTSFKFDLSRWYHVAVVRNGTSFSLYIDGALVQSITGSPVFSLSQPVRIGWWSWPGVGEYWNGYIDEFRISKGIARWNSNFTPPNSQYYWWSWGCNGSSGGTNGTCGANKYQ